MRSIAKIREKAVFQVFGIKVITGNTAF